MELENSRLHSTRTCAAFQVYYAKVFCFFASAGVASGLQVVKFWLFPSVCWGVELVGLHLYLFSLHCTFFLAFNSDFSAFHIQNPICFAAKLLNSEGIYFLHLMTGTNKFPKDSDSMPSAFKLISILSYQSHTCSFFVSYTELTIAISKLPCG